jgi:cobaltochelatase CobN
VAVVLWAVETLRNEGVNESTLLWLMGIRPRWQQSGKVAGLEVVPVRELGRPRIDVLINASGLYRDLFPEKMFLLDEAVQLAIRQSDIDNLLAENSRRIRDRLLAGGMEEKEAVELSRLRVFSEEPGSYGNGVSEMTGASGLWQDEDEVVDVYQKRQGFAFGGERWGVPAVELFRYQLAAVDVALHSRSSNVYGLLDNDDMFQYLGGLAMPNMLFMWWKNELLVVITPAIIPFLRRWLLPSSSCQGYSARKWWKNLKLPWGSLPVNQWTNR